MNTINLSQERLLVELRAYMWQASNKLIWGMIFIIAFVSILDVIIVPESYLELTILKLTGLCIIIFSNYFLTKVQHNPLLLLHIALLTFTFVYLLSLSVVASSGQILYLVVLAVTYVSFNTIAIWRVADAVAQFATLCVCLFLLNYFDIMPLKPLLVLGGYTCLAVCAVSVCFPAIRMLSLKDHIEEEIAEKKEIKMANRRNLDLEKLINERNLLIKKFENDVKMLRHDLKNRLNSIHSLAELIEMEDRYLLKPGDDDYLNLIKTSVADLIDSGNKLFKPFESQMNREQLELVTTSVDVHAIIQNTKNKLFDKTISKNITLAMDLNASSAVIDIDKNLGEVAVYNLIKYAVNFSKNNDTVHIITRLDQNRLILEILNKTSGLSMVSLDSYFKNIDEYKLKEAQQNKGLGLSIAKKNIELLGGHLSYNSSVSLGFEFLVEFNSSTLPN